MLKLSAAILMAAFAAEAAQAEYTVTLTQVGKDVVAKGSGTLNLAAIKRDSTYDGPGDPFMEPNFQTLWTGVGSGKLYGINWIGPSDSWGSQFGPFDGAGSGDAVYFDFSGLLGVPAAYKSGAFLSSSATLADQTFADWGVAIRAGQPETTYSYTYGSLGNYDRFTVTFVTAAPPTTPVGSSNGAVPEPDAWAMMISGMGAVGVVLRRKVLAGERAHS